MGPTVERRERYGLFEWDSDKEASNEQKHGISFEDACAVFTDPFHVMGDASDKNEERSGIIGHALSIHPDHPLYVVAKDLGENHWRIVSAGRATKKERRRYEEEAY